jgi:hypothetical protein
MYTIYDLILACIMGGIGGILIGLAIMGISASRGYDDAVSDAYDIGYAKGKEEEHKRVMKNLEMYQCGKL